VRALSAVVVEDERLPRDELCTMLGELGVDVVQTASDVESGRQALRDHEPDLAFLDVQLGSDSVFDVLEGLDHGAELVFVTAYDRFAIRAFEVNALDYLLKPVDPERLAATVARARARRASPDSSVPDTPVPDLRIEDRLFVRDGRRWRFVKVKEIRAIEADGDYTRLRLDESKDILLSTSMTRWEDALPASHFVRIHRSTIVNLDHVTEVEEWFNRAFRVYVDGRPDPYRMSRRYARKLRGTI